MSGSRFTLQFEPSLLHKLAAGYDYGGDDKVEEIGRAARARGYYTKHEFDQVCYWKSPRSASRAKRDNSAANVEDITRVALAAGTSEELRIWAPQALAYVSWPTASVLLHFGHADPYPILDYRALEALGLTRQAAYTMPFWLEYLDFTRGLAQDLGVSMRTLDRALWQWSKDEGGFNDVAPARGAPSDHPPVPPGTTRRSTGSKSERMRVRFADGASVADVTHEMGVPYGFAYGVRQRWLAKGGGEKR